MHIYKDELFITGSIRRLFILAKAHLSLLVKTSRILKRGNLQIEKRLLVSKLPKRTLNRA